MAEANLSATSLPAHALPHPMANPGYGKRSAPDQHPRTAHDFAHLPPREAAIAAYVDRLPDGADISVKTLAKTLPYGQCALRTALNNLQRAGHLRRGREHLAEPGGICGACRGERAPGRDHTPLPASAVHTRAAEIRAAMSQQQQRTHP